MTRYQHSLLITSICFLLFVTQVITGAHVFHVVWAFLCAGTCAIFSSNIEQQMKDISYE